MGGVGQEGLALDDPGHEITARPAAYLVTADSPTRVESSSSRRLSLRVTCSLKDEGGRKPFGHKPAEVPIEGTREATLRAIAAA